MAFYTLENEVFRRVFEVSASGIRSVSMIDKRSNLEYLPSPAREFQFSLDDRMFSSWMSNIVRIVDGNTEVNEFAPEFIREERSGNTLSFYFTIDGIEVAVFYNIYPGICGYRKHITLKNTRQNDIKSINSFLTTPVPPPEKSQTAIFTPDSTMIRRLSVLLARAMKIWFAVTMNHWMPAGSWGHQLREYCVI